MNSAPREYTLQEVLDLIENDPAAENSWRQVTQDLPREMVEVLKETLVSIANAPWFLAECKRRNRALIQPKRLSRLAASLERLAPSVEAAVRSPYVQGRLWRGMARHPEVSADALSEAQKWLAEIPAGMRWIAKAIRMSTDESRHKKWRVRDQMAMDTRLFLLGLEAADRLDFQCAVDILGPVYKAAGAEAPVPKKRLLPSEPLPTIESLQALRRRRRFPF